ncbi:MAG: amino acid permease [Rhodospirillales bacterium]
MTSLRRSLSFPLVVLYGLGTTIGAGIYVLLGAAVEHAGLLAPLSFIAAAIVMVFSAASFAELSARFPVSAGEAAYAREGYRSSRLSLVVGLMVVASGIISSAAISIGSVGYIRELVDVNETVMAAIVILLIGAVVAWGIVESVLLVSLFTVIEVGALILIIVVGFSADPQPLDVVPEMVPAFTYDGVWGVAGAALIAFFAFIGFEDMVNLAEEVHEPERVLPSAIFATLILTTLIYVLIAIVAVGSVPLDELAASRAPLSLVFERVAGVSPLAITLIAIVATLNGVIVQMIMASRVLYGLANMRSLPSALSRINETTRTPLIATATVVGFVLALALMFPITALATWTSGVVLVVFILVNGALWRIKRRDGNKAGVFTVPLWVPIAGILSCGALLITGFAG